MKIRTKFRVDSVTRNVDGAQVSLSVVTSGSLENQMYFNHTPYGTVILGILNHEASKAFTPGMEVYVDFLTDVEENKQDTIEA